MIIPAHAAVVGAEIVVDTGKLWPILLVNFPILPIPPDNCRARASTVVHGDLRSVLGRDHFIGKASHLVQSSYPNIGDAGIEISGRV